MLDAPSKILTVLIVVKVVIIVSLGVDLIPVKVRQYLVPISKNTLPIYGIHWC